MSQHTRSELIRTIRQSIARLETLAQATHDERMLQRVLAYLWMAHDELEQLRADQPH